MPFSSCINQPLPNPMRPFVCTLLKCQKCGSTHCPKLTPEEVVQISLPACLPHLADLRTEGAFLEDLVGTMTQGHNRILKVNEADVYAFVEEGAEEGIAELLCGVDVIRGTVACVDCGEVRQIRDGILFCVDEN